MIPRFIVGHVKAEDYYMPFSVKVMVWVIVCCAYVFYSSGVGAWECYV